MWTGSQIWLMWELQIWLSRGGWRTFFKHVGKHQTFFTLHDTQTQMFHLHISADIKHKSLKYSTQKEKNCSVLLDEHVVRIKSTFVSNHHILNVFWRKNQTDTQEVQMKTHTELHHQLIRAHVRGLDTILFPLICAKQHVWHKYVPNKPRSQIRCERLQGGWQSSVFRQTALSWLTHHTTSVWWH